MCCTVNQHPFQTGNNTLPGFSKEDRTSTFSAEMNHRYCYVFCYSQNRLLLCNRSALCLWTCKSKLTILLWGLGCIHVYFYTMNMSVKSGILDLSFADIPCACNKPPFCHGLPGTLWIWAFSLLLADARRSTDTWKGLSFILLYSVYKRQFFKTIFFPEAELKRSSGALHPWPTP